METGSTFDHIKSFYENCDDKYNKAILYEDFDDKYETAMSCEGWEDKCENLTGD